MERNVFDQFKRSSAEGAFTARLYQYAIECVRGLLDRLRGGSLGVLYDKQPYVGYQRPVWQCKLQRAEWQLDL